MFLFVCESFTKFPSGQPFKLRSWGIEVGVVCEKLKTYRNYTKFLYKETIQETINYTKCQNWVRGSS